MRQSVSGFVIAQTTVADPLWPSVGLTNCAIVAQSVNNVCEKMIFVFSQIGVIVRPRAGGESEDSRNGGKRGR